MDCRESRELMSGAVDKQLEKGEAESFYEHIEICGSCRDEFELERLTKAYIKRKITFVDVPYDLERAIMVQLAAEGSVSTGVVAGTASKGLFQPLLALGIVLVLAVLLFFANRPGLIMPEAPGSRLAAAATTNGDALAIAENNFQNVLSGKFKPQITAITSDEVASFIRQNAGYSMSLPDVRSADWVGGSVSSDDGNKMAHIVYKMGENYIYLCCFPKGVVSSKKVTLPAQCVDAIGKNGWFWTQDEDGDVQAVWNARDNVCIATANLEKKDLVAYLQPPEGEKNP